MAVKLNLVVVFCSVYCTIWHRRSWRRFLQQSPANDHCGTQTAGILCLQERVSLAFDKKKLTNILSVG